MRKRGSNPFKVFISATQKRGPKTLFWFNGKKFVQSKIGRASFSSIGLAKIMRRRLMLKYPVLKKYDVELWSKIT